MMSPLYIGMLRQGDLFLTTIGLIVMFFASNAWCAIPAGERAVLLQLYTSTNGDNCTN